MAEVVGRWGNGGKTTTTTASIMNAHYFFKSFTKFRIEYRIYYGINERIEVSQPRGEYECGHSRLARLRQFRAESIEYVACKKRNPTYEENPCEKHSKTKERNLATLNFSFSYDVTIKRIFLFNGRTGGRRNERAKNAREIFFFLNSRRRARFFFF